MTYGEALQEILDFELSGVLYRYHSDREFGNKTEELPPSKRGYKANLWSFSIMYCFDIREKTTHLSRKKKKRLALHFNKKYNKLKRYVDAMEES